MKYIRILLSKLSALKSIYLDHQLVVTYKKIDAAELPRTDVGYIDIETVAQRYDHWLSYSIYKNIKLWPWQNIVNFTGKAVQAEKS